jgi:hypothetical protein
MESFNNWMYAVEDSLSSKGGWLLTIDWTAGSIDADSEPFWKDFAVDGDGWVETAGWLGRLNVVDAPWIWSDSLNAWVFAQSFGSGAAWFYFFSQVAA